MRTVVLGPPPPELEAVLRRRHELGQDLYDEVWEGVYHMAPAPRAAHGIVDDELAALLRPLAKRAGLVGTGPVNIGRPEDYRVPDRALHREPPQGVWVPTAAMVVEITSPDDDTYEKFGFYAARGVDEVLVADPQARTVRLFRAAEDPARSYDEVPDSALLGVSAVEMASRIAWPAP